MVKAAASGYTLSDAEALSKEFPDTFVIPPEKKRKKLLKGDIVKLAFLNPKKRGERMWVEVTTAKKPDGQYIGRLMNHPVVFGDIVNYGSIIPFGPQHVYEIFEKE